MSGATPLRLSSAPGSPSIISIDFAFPTRPSPCRARLTSWGALDVVDLRGNRRRDDAELLQHAELVPVGPVLGPFS